MTRAGAGRHLERRDMLRTHLLLDLAQGRRMTSADIKDRYYRDVADSSFHKTFKRDRDALAAEGAFLTAHSSGTAKSWSIDRTRSLASVSEESDAEARVASVILRALVTDPSTPDAGLLGQSIARLGRGSCEGMVSGRATTCDRDVLVAATQALQAHKPCALSYRALGEQATRRRVMRIYGIFELGGATYAVGLRSREGAQDAMRTLNLARAQAAEVLLDETSYAIPPDFDLDDYRLLPFEIGGDASADLRLHAPKALAPALLGRVRRRGAASCADDGSVVWTGTTRNYERAASWAIEVGVIPLAPHEVVERWEGMLRGVIGDA